jgi:hypothetical protein
LHRPRLSLRGQTARLARKEETAARAMKHATGTIRGGHNPKRPYRATAASRRCTTPRCRIGRPGAMASAAPACPRAALQRFKALEPAPFPPQRLMLDLLEAPKPPTARPRVVAAACALPAAPEEVAKSAADFIVSACQPPLDDISRVASYARMMRWKGLSSDEQNVAKFSVGPAPVRLFLIAL